MAEIQDRHIKAAGAWARKFLEVRPLRDRVTVAEREIYAQALADQEAVHAELRAATEGILRGGEHEGPCDNEDEHPAVRGSCGLHVDAAKARRRRLVGALEQLDQVTLSSQLDT